MASSDEYQQQNEWNQIVNKPCFFPGDGSQMDINSQIYAGERERNYWFKKVTGVSGEDVFLFNDNDLNNTNNDTIHNH
ncbi:MAG: hypothetical protein WC055_02045 [Melioribacteraceae bacterium]